MPITRRRRANPPDQPENNNHLADQSESTPETLATEEEAPILSMDGEQAGMPMNERMGNADISSVSSSHPSVSNGDRLDRQDYIPPIEGGKRTARGELFRRPPQPPPGSSLFWHADNNHPRCDITNIVDASFVTQSADQLPHEQPKGNRRKNERH